MKRVVALLLIVVMAVSLTACASLQPYETTAAGVTLLVDPRKQTLTHGEDEYQYGRWGEEIRITYPNGGHYSYNQEKGYASWSGIHETGKTYLHGSVLAAAVPESAQVRRENTDWIVIVSAIFALMGLWHVLLPRKSLFMLAYGWGIWKAEESSANVRAIRLIGAIMVAAALFCIALTLI